jgi:hypothetical protein
MLVTVDYRLDGRLRYGVRYDAKLALPVQNGLRKASPPQNLPFLEPTAMYHTKPVLYCFKVYQKGGLIQCVSNLGQFNARQKGRIMSSQHHFNARDFSKEVKGSQEWLIQAWYDLVDFFQMGEQHAFDIGDKIPIGSYFRRGMI